MDGIVKDGLWDAYNQFLMGDAAEIIAEEMNFTREDQACVYKDDDRIIMRFRVTKELKHQLNQNHFQMK